MAYRQLARNQPLAPQTTLAVQGKARPPDGPGGPIAPPQCPTPPSSQPPTNPSQTPPHHQQQHPHGIPGKMSPQEGSGPPVARPPGGQPTVPMPGQMTPPTHMTPPLGNAVSVNILITIFFL